jgi:hypothetical protein
MKIRKADGCLWFMSNRITAAFTVGLYFGLPLVLSHSRTKGDLTVYVRKLSLPHDSAREPCGSRTLRARKIIFARRANIFS